jgi:hypothetical protein
LTHAQGKKLSALLYDHIRAPLLQQGKPASRSASVAFTEHLTAEETAVIDNMDASFTSEQRALMAEHFKFEHARAAFETTFASTSP